jgi:hypothetical protein
MRSASGHRRVDVADAGHRRWRGVAAALLLLGGLSGCNGAPDEPEAVGGPPLVRRLTESQYRATVADIFGTAIPVAARFEHGLRAEGLIAIGTSEAGMSAFSIEQYDAAALGVAAAVVSAEHRQQLVGCAPPSVAAFDEACATRFVERYGQRLFRRPLSADETHRFVEAARSGHARLGNFYSGLEFALAGMMVSPEFLLRIERIGSAPERSGPARLDAYSKATRLAYFLTDSTPDDELLRAAGKGELDTGKGLERQVDRLIASPHFEQALRAFFKDMLEFDRFDELAKDPQVYPAFNSNVAADAQEQTLLTITDQLIAQRGDYRELFTTRKAYLTRNLGVVYRLPVPTRSGWEISEFPPDSQRAGIQSQVAFLALHSHPGRSSPTLRGLAMRKIFLCQDVPDPPANVNFAIVQDASNKSMPTARDRLEAHRTQPSCAGCHKIMDPLGLTLENFDGLGLFRTQESGAPIDASGSLDGLDFNTPAGLAQALHDHPETPRCLVEKMYRFAVGRDTRIEERPYMDYLIESFRSGGYRVPDLMRRIALSQNFFAIAPAEDAESPAPHIASQTLNGDRS